MPLTTATFPYSLPAPKPIRQFDEHLDLSSLSLSDFDLDGLNALSALNLGKLGEGDVLNLGVEERRDDEEEEIDSVSSSVTEVPQSTYVSSAAGVASTSKVHPAVLPPSPSESSSSSSIGASHPASGLI